MSTLYLVRKGYSNRCYHKKVHNMIDNLLPFILFVIAMTGTPGPGNLTMLAIGQTTGFASSIRFLIGAGAGCVILDSLVACGLGELIISIPAVATTLRIAGLIYILYLAGKILAMQFTPPKGGKTLYIFRRFSNPPIEPQELGDGHCRVQPVHEARAAPRAPDCHICDQLFSRTPGLSQFVVCRRSPHSAINQFPTDSIWYQLYHGCAYGRCHRVCVVRVRTGDRTFPGSACSPSKAKEPDQYIEKLVRQALRKLAPENRRRQTHRLATSDPRPSLTMSPVLGTYHF